MIHFAKNLAGGNNDPQTEEILENVRSALKDPHERERFEDISQGITSAVNRILEQINSQRLSA